jgi:hypothetical protein
MFAASSAIERAARDRCYDHNFLRFLPIFGNNIGVFSKTNVMINFLAKTSINFENIFAETLSKKLAFFTQCFGENIFKIITSVPGILLTLHT